MRTTTRRLSSDIAHVLQEKLRVRSKEGRCACDCMTNRDLNKSCLTSVESYRTVFFRMRMGSQLRVISRVALSFSRETAWDHDIQRDGHWLFKQTFQRYITSTTPKVQRTSVELPYIYRAVNLLLRSRQYPSLSVNDIDEPEGPEAIRLRARTTSLSAAADIDYLHLWGSMSKCLRLTSHLFRPSYQLSPHVIA